MTWLMYKPLRTFKRLRSVSTRSTIMLTVSKMLPKKLLSNCWRSGPGIDYENISRTQYLHVPFLSSLFQESFLISFHSHESRTDNFETSLMLFSTRRSLISLLLRPSSTVFQIAIRAKMTMDAFSYPFAPFQLPNLHRPHVVIPDSISFVGKYIISCMLFELENCILQVLFLLRIGCVNVNRFFLCTPVEEGEFLLSVPSHITEFAKYKLVFTKELFMHRV